MATIDTAPAASETERLARGIEQAAAKEAHTIGDYTTDVREQASALMKGGGELEKVGQALEKNASDVTKATDGSASIKIDELEPGLNGFTKIGGSDSDITVNTSLLSDTDQLAEVIDHEKRHNEQVVLESTGDTLLVTASGEEIKDDVLLYEGDTETHTAETFGRRDDQPEEYAKGHDLAEEIQKDHEQAWDETLTVHGDLGLLQKEIWAKALQEGTLKMEELTKQASRTGYDKEAAEVLSDYVKSNGMEYAMGA